MSLLDGFYTPDTENTVYPSPTIQIRQFDRPTCLVSITATGVGGISTTEVEVGDWDGVFFTPDQTIGYVSAPIDTTNQAPIFFLVSPLKAIRVTST